MLQSEQVDLIYPAFLKFQASVKKIEKTTTAQRGDDFWDFAPLPEILEVLKPAFKRLELGIMQDSRGDGESAVGAKSRLIHTSGQWIETDWLMIPGVHNADEAGSSLTRARRWSLLALLNISPSDGDGHTVVVKAEPTMEDEYRSLIGTAKKNKTDKAVLEQLGKPTSMKAAVAAYTALTPDEREKIRSIAMPRT